MKLWFSKKKKKKKWPQVEGECWAQELQSPGFGV